MIMSKHMKAPPKGWIQPWEKALIEAFEAERRIKLTQRTIIEDNMVEAYRLGYVRFDRTAFERRHDSAIREIRESEIN